LTIQSYKKILKSPNILKEIFAIFSKEIGTKKLKEMSKNENNYFAVSEIVCIFASSETQCYGKRRKGYENHLWEGGKLQVTARLPEGRGAGSSD
jgi:hypothetical protein